jgi:hypothetical protein
MAVWAYSAPEPGCGASIRAGYFGEKPAREGSRLCSVPTRSEDIRNRHSVAMQSIEPGISGFRDAQLRIRGLVLRTIPE